MFDLIMTSRFRVTPCIIYAIIYDVLFMIYATIMPPSIPVLLSLLMAELRRTFIKLSRFV